MLQQQIKSEIPTAMRAKDQLKLNTLRGLAAAFTNELVATKRKPDEELPDEDVLTVIRREVKKRKEAAEAFRGGGREELAEKEDKERVMLEAYLPALMSREEITTIAKTKMAEMGISSKADAGKFTGALMKELKGKADGSDVKAVVDEMLG